MTGKGDVKKYRANYGIVQAFFYNGEGYFGDYPAWLMEMLTTSSEMMEKVTKEESSYRLLIEPRQAFFKECELVIGTPEGTIVVRKGNYVVKDENNKVFWLKPDAFKAIYTEIDENVWKEMDKIQGM